MRRLVIYLPTLDSGGAEKLHLNLAPEFNAMGYEVSFLLHRATGSLLPLVPEGIPIFSMDCGRTLAGLLPLARFLKREQPDILLANLGHNNILALWAKAISNAPTRIVTSFHNTLSGEAGEHANWKNKILPTLCRLFLKRSDGVVAVSNGVADDLAQIARLPRSRIEAIYNPVVFADFDARMSEEPPHPWFSDSGPPILLAVGRLNRQKDFATLLNAFARLRESMSARLIILGEGELKAELETQAAALGVAEAVSLPGFVANPLPFMRKAAGLVMSSRYEGFGNVLVEALACGTPVASTDCPHGPSEILQGGRYGPLTPVGDAEALTAAMRLLLQSPLPAETLRARGREFTVTRAAQAYDHLFRRITAA